MHPRCRFRTLDGFPVCRNIKQSLKKNGVIPKKECGLVKFWLESNGQSWWLTLDLKVVIR